MAAADQQKRRLRRKPSDARSNALVVIVALLGRFISVGICRRRMGGRRRRRDLLTLQSAALDGSEPEKKENKGGGLNRARARFSL